MQIGICDDNNVWLSRVSHILEHFLSDIGIEYTISTFSEGKKLLSYEGLPLDVVFLDIQMKEENGIMVAKEINRKWKGCQIVFLTNYLSWATEVYETEHTWFVLKDQFEDKLGKIMDKVLKKDEEKANKIILTVIGGEKACLASEDIYYMERDRRYTVVYTAWGSFRVREKLDELMEILPPLDFVRCHNSFVVHLRQVREMKKDRFVLDHDTEIMISRRYLKKTKEAFARRSLLQVL